MTKDQIQEIKETVIKKRDEIISQLQASNEKLAESIKDTSGDISSYSMHLADRGTDSIEREKSFFFASREGRFLSYLNETLEKIEKGTYDGKCSECGEDIDINRLKAVPHASKCINCKAKEEKNKY